MVKTLRNSGMKIYGCKNIKKLFSFNKIVPWIHFIWINDVSSAIKCFYQRDRTRGPLNRTQSYRAPQRRLACTQHILGGTCPEISCTLGSNDQYFFFILTIYRHHTEPRYEKISLQAKISDQLRLKPVCWTTEARIWYRNNKYYTI